MPRLPVCLALLALAAVPRATAQPPRADETKAIRSVLDAQVVAWNKGDLEGFMAGYWKSPDLSFFSGKTKTRGWQATLDRYRKQYQADGKEMGQTPITLSEVAPGAHVVRIEMAGKKSWTSLARVTPGKLERVTGSLEDQR